MNGNPFQDGVKFFQFHPIRGVLPVLLGDIPAGTWHATCFVLSAFHDYLNPIAFTLLGHNALGLKRDARIKTLGI